MSTLLMYYDQVKVSMKTFKALSDLKDSCFVNLANV